MAFRETFWWDIFLFTGFLNWLSEWKDKIWLFPCGMNNKINTICTWNASWSFFCSIKAICRSKQGIKKQQRITGQDNEKQRASQIRSVWFFKNWILQCEIWEAFVSYSSGPARRGPILHRPRLWKPVAGSSCKKQRDGQQSVENLRVDTELAGEHTMLFSM